MSSEVWAEPTAALRGSIVVLAGRGEQQAVYRRFAARLAYDGYRVAVVADAAADLDGTAAEVARLLQDRTDVPRILVGSDTGASVAATLLAQGLAFADVAVLAGLPVAGATGELDWSAELEARSACPVHRGVLDEAGALDHGSLSRRDPVLDAVDAATLAGVLVPVLTLHGTADVISPVEAAAAVYDAAPEVESYLIEGGRHDILNDVTHRSVAATVVLFLERLRSPGRERVVLPAREALPLATMKV
ncbi:alpha/beta hydrolase [Herbiconiux sp. KACC 21604]|uniref:alpha/beta hydrolase n=1 Tax=unclassified Herbiconiux TaxID=2618217 RepID=UPI001C110BAE|nr:alpha/beta hydrolase [Herbiconiux sp. SALV-R1]WPO84919.1 alpha/beta hydrolase [Herbiconiux sp. KACC 21604]